MLATSDGVRAPSGTRRFFLAGVAALGVAAVIGTTFFGTDDAGNDGPIASVPSQPPARVAADPQPTSTAVVRVQVTTSPAGALLKRRIYGTVPKSQVGPAGHSTMR